MRQFLAETLPANLARRVRLGQHLGKSETEAWQAALSARGWLAPHWPKDYGGPGWGCPEVHLCLRDSPGSSPRVVAFGVNMLGPVLIKYGTEAQKRYWLPRILDGSDWWCQGYSEPGAGSDLASVRTTAAHAATASTTSSTARRLGPPSASTPT